MLINNLKIFHKMIHRQNNIEKNTLILQFIFAQIFKYLQPSILALFFVKFYHTLLSSHCTLKQNARTCIKTSYGIQKHA